MGFGPRGLETALANRTARGGAGPAGVAQPHVRCRLSGPPWARGPGRVPGQRRSLQGRFSGAPASLLT